MKSESLPPPPLRDVYNLKNVNNGTAAEQGDARPKAIYARRPLNQYIPAAPATRQTLCRHHLSGTTAPPPPPTPPPPTQSRPAAPWKFKINIFTARAVATVTAAVHDGGGQINRRYFHSKSTYHQNLRSSYL